MQRLASLAGSIFSRCTRSNVTKIAHLLRWRLLRVPSSRFRDFTLTTNRTRRKFLQYTTAVLGTGALAACNDDPTDPVLGVDEAAEANARRKPLPSTNNNAAPAPAPAPAQVTEAPTPAPSGPVSGAQSNGACRFVLVSAASVQNAPFCVGFAFKRGDIPVGSTAVSSTPGLQVTPRNYWPDGSLKFAQIAGQISLAAATPAAVDLRRGFPPAAGADLTLADLKRTGITAQTTCGSIGTVAWSATDWDAPLLQWTAGPAMSSWIYRRPVGNDAHLVAWLEVRVYSGGAVEALPWVENGYINVPGPTNKNATYSFSLGGSQRFSGPVDLKHHQRTPLLSGTALSYWNVSDPGLSVQHDAFYLMSTELVPTYFAAQGAATTAISALPASFAPLQPGSFNYDGDSMAAAGYQDPIGLLPQHDVLYLTGASFNSYAAVVRNGFSAGRYGIHYRDEATHRPLRFSQHPNRVIADGQGFKDNGGSTTGSRTPAATGGNPPGWDVAHSPSVGYMAYLLTGRWYFMEEVLFAATANYLGNGDNAALRTGAQGLVQTAVDAWQTRSCAWDWRSKIQALTVTPDSDSALRNELIACVEANVAHFHGRYVAQPNNAFGLILPGESYNGTISEIAIWQQDFVTAVFGWAVSLDLPISSAAKTNLASFFQWKAKSVVMRLGTRSDWWYINADPYTIKTGTALSVQSYAAGTGPWPASVSALYASTFTPAPAWLGSAEGTLAGEYDAGFWGRAMWGNLQPALAYAVRHAVPGAVEGYTRMVSASNWGALVDGFNQRPVWSVAPSVTPAVTTVKAVAPVTGATYEWVELPGTSGAGGAAVNAWGTYVLIDGTATLVSAANGGHGDSSDNRVTSIDLLQASPRWVQRIAPSASTDVRANSDYYADGAPVSRHGYHHAHYIPQRGRVMLFGARGWYQSGGDGFAVDGVAVGGTWAWDRAGTYPSTAGARGFGSVRDPLTGNVWTTGGWRWNQASNAWTQVTSFPTSWRWPVAYDSARRLFFTLQFGDGQGYDLQRGIVATKFDPMTGAQTSITFNASAALSQFQADQPAYAGMDYDSANDRFLFYDGVGQKAGRVYAVTPNSGSTWDISILSVSGVTPAATVSAGINGRFRYVPALKGFVMHPHASANLYFLRTA